MSSLRKRAFPQPSPRPSLRPPQCKITALAPLCVTVSADRRAFDARRGRRPLQRRPYLQDPVGHRSGSGACTRTGAPRGPQLPGPARPWAHVYQAPRPRVAVTALQTSGCYGNVPALRGGRDWRSSRKASSGTWHLNFVSVRTCPAPCAGTRGRGRCEDASASCVGGVCAVTVPPGDADGGACGSQGQGPGWSRRRPGNTEFPQFQGDFSLFTFQLPRT